VFDIAGATVIVDYGHNPSSLAAILSAMQEFPQQMRTAVYSVAGDRRDSDIVRQGELLGGAFDRVILYEDHYLRGRVQGEIVGLLRSGLANARRTRELQAYTQWTEAVDTALRIVRPGELLLIQADVVDQAVNYLKSFLAANASVNGNDLSTTVENGGTLKAPSFLHAGG
jgi:cyanophycin synthetase